MQQINIRHNGQVGKVKVFSYFGTKKTKKRNGDKEREGRTQLIKLAFGRIETFNILNISIEKGNNL